MENKSKNIKVIIIHGWEGKPNSNWFPWLKEELGKKDPYVPMERGETIRDKLGAGHFNESDGYTKLPVVLEKILAIID